jgi:hypothetical protein
MAFENVLAMTEILPVQASRIIHGLRRQDLTSLGDRLGSGSDVHHRSDGGEVSMGSTDS